MKKRNWLKLMAVAVVACSTAAFAQEASVSAKTMVKGNPDSKIYHKSACHHYAAKGSSKEFQTEADAVKAGYKPCKQCAAPKKDKKDKKDNVEAKKSDSVK